MLRHCLATLIVSIGMLFADGRACIAADGIQFVGNKLLLNKDVNGERWAITVDPVALPDVGGLAITGNVFRSGGSPPSFISCKANTGGLPPDVGTGLRMHCFAREACTQLSTSCFDGGVDLGEVIVPYSFFEYPAPANGHRLDSSIVLVGELAHAVHFPLNSRECLIGTCEDGAVIQSSFGNPISFQCPSGQSVQVEIILRSGPQTDACTGSVENGWLLRLGKVYNLDVAVIPNPYAWSMTGYSQPPETLD